MPEASALEIASLLGLQITTIRGHLQKPDAPQPVGKRPPLLKGNQKGGKFAALYDVDAVVAFIRAAQSRRSANHSAANRRRYQPGFVKKPPPVVKQHRPAKPVPVANIPHGTGLQAKNEILVRLQRRTRARNLREYYAAGGTDYGGGDD